MTQSDIGKKLDKIQASLDRLEARQISAREELKEKISETKPVVGSFGSSELPQEEDK